MGVATKEDDAELSAPPFGIQGTRDFCMGLVALGSKFLFNVLNRTEIVHHERYLEAALSRPEGQGLITVANHTSTLDDPCLPCVMLPLSHMCSESQHLSNRWVFCAADICFKNELLSTFFRSGKTLPLERGGGLEQKAMDVAAYKVRNGEWVHTFPEGKVNTKTPADEMLPFKWGVGKLICDSATGPVYPMVVPWYHRHMEKVKEVKNPRIGVGQTVQVVVGEPMQLDDLLERCSRCRKDAEKQKLWSEITARVRSSLEELKAQSEPQQVADLANA
mmetsp:Transcript_10494/g.21848  ORF Transcript_10494/g.21848 Transcript_10494/m.21848 type:complete len:276 (+) Transcript_10494:120-947(+)|eukprot:CAMPEP_0118922296 /NCGR_PEP_ID=MMETSP1169-20130426/1272_1 /TAXON_ID=36882 /ORGANISM="Pyramimonas obovata, Strain CCMP722" /LENGTH=275 /DNA_ID=CAMNT_0006863135 /DNA_START=56 /DNA_END=883 /DNA_ORIENTATION=-